MGWKRRLYRDEQSSALTTLPRVSVMIVMHLAPLRAPGDCARI
jgi:hypothetical protein